MTADRDARDSRERRARGAPPKEDARSWRLEPPPAPPSYTGTKIVLVVDECAETREILTQYLMRQGLIPMPVPDGAHAQVICETLSPDAVLLHLARPHARDLALIGHIKARRPGTPVLVISGGLAAEHEARAKGADDVLPKPVDLKRLGQTLACLLRPLPERLPLRPAAGRRSGSAWPPTADAERTPPSPASPTC